MKKRCSILVFCVIFFSCERNDMAGTQTVVKGNVSDKYRGTKIENYKVTLIKAWRCCSNFMCGWCREEVTTVYTDKDGNYSIPFNYKVKEGQSYAIDRNYDSPYLPDDTTDRKIVAGKENIIDIVLWQPVKLKLNLDIKNNIAPPLMVNVRFNNDYTYGTDNSYEKEVIKTTDLWTRPSSNVFIEFWYFEDYIHGNGLHQKTIPYTTSLDSVSEMSYEVDCSTF